MDALKAVETLLQINEDAKRLFKQAEDEEEYRNREYTDIAHALEFIQFGGVDGYRLARQLKDCRLARREAKNAQEELKPFIDMLNKYQALFRDLRQVHAAIEVTRNRQSNRVFTPRVRVDLGEEIQRRERRNGGKAHETAGSAARA